MNSLGDIYGTFFEKNGFWPDAALASTALEICPRSSIAMKFMFVKINSKRSNGVKKSQISGSE